MKPSQRSLISLPFGSTWRWTVIALLLALIIRTDARAEDGFDSPTDTVLVPDAIQNMIYQHKQDVLKLDAQLAVKLKKEQVAATKRGDLNLALWIKDRIDKLEQQATKGDALGFSGKYSFDLHNGHFGDFEVKKRDVAGDNGHRGTVSKTENGWDILWDNSSHWIITQHDGSLWMKASDGVSELKAH